MPQILIRDIPQRLKNWIDDKSYNLRTSQKEFVLSVLMKAYNVKFEPSLFDSAPSEPVRPREEGIPFSFIDLFSGIGGLRLGLERNGGRCLFSSEWDRNAQKTYHAWFGEMPHGDIREIDPAKIPDYDVLAVELRCLLIDQIDHSQNQ